MNLPSISSSHLAIPVASFSDILNQLNRDLKRAGEGGLELDEITAETLIEGVNQQLVKLHKRDSSSIWSFLYLVDLPEDIIHSLQPFESNLNELSRFILIREWQKVVIRQHFSS